MWTVQATTEYLEWFSGLEPVSKEAHYSAVSLLEEFGPRLGRPYVDTVKGSRYANLKELRVQCKGHVYRVLFIFNRKRQAVLLAGDDKKGRDEKRFYASLIREAERTYERYQAELEG